MKVYLAAPYAARELIRGYADELHTIGYTVVSTWLAEKHDINAGTTGAATQLAESVVATHARTDLNDIDRADVVVLFTVETCAAALGIGDVLSSTSGGRHVETGYAIARGIPVLVVGQPENVFHRLLTTTVVASWHEAVVDLAGRLVDRTRSMPQASTCAGGC